MTRKVLATMMTLFVSAAMMPAVIVRPVLAQETGSQTENVDFSKIAGYWSNGDSDGEESITITGDGIFVYYTKEAGDTQGYLEYVDEYGDGNGRYDMYNRVGIWLAGLYQDGDNSLHMGNVDGTVFTRIEECGGAESESQAEEPQTSSYVLTPGTRYTGLKPMYNDSSWNGGYFYSDMTEDGMTVIVNCSAANEENTDGTEKKFRKRFASLVSESKIQNYKEKKNKSLTKKFSYPVYNLTFTTGENEDTCQWKMIFFQTDTNTYAYAYKMNADAAADMAEEYKNAINSLTLTEISDEQTSVADYDPSAEGKSLEMFISYFDSWYQYGDLNAANIRLYGEGTWEIYNARNTDGSGGYLFDSGTFKTSGTTALQLYSSDGSYVADVSLDGNGELMLTPMISGYGSIYADAAFSRESESVAYEAQTAGEGNDDYVPNEEGYYEEDGRGDYIPDDYVEESDPGDTYYWYDDAGDVIFFDGYENIYIGPGDVFYIDDAGRLAEY